jgi:hypothetical protein
MKTRVLVSLAMAIASVGFFYIALDQIASGKLNSSSLRGKMVYAIGLPADLVGRFIPIGHINTPLVVAFLLSLVIFYSLVFWGILTGISILFRRVEKGRN